MYNYIEGFAEKSGIKYCPKCGNKKIRHKKDDSGSCKNCGFRFAVLEVLEKRGEK